MKKSKALVLSTLGAAILVGFCAFFSGSGDSGKGSQAAPNSSAFRRAINAKQNTPQPRLARADGAKLMSKAQAPLLFTLAPKLPVPLQTPVPAGVDPKTLPRQKTVLSTTVLNAGSLPDLATLKKDQIIGLPLPDGRSFDARVNLVKPAAGIIRAGGSLMPASAGAFTLSQIGQKLEGMIRLPAENLAYVIESRDDGRILMQEHLLSDLMCLGMPTEDNPPAQQQPQAAPLVAAIPALDSLPGAAAVLYIDFDGEVINDSHWNSGQTIYAAAPLYSGKPLTDTHITQVWQAVSEDYAGFNISVTTIRSRYDNAAPGSRIRCIVTPTQDWTGSAPVGGLAYLGSFAGAGTTFDDDVPCWCFGIYDPANMALIVSHECGHTFGLSHDGLDPDPLQTGENGESEYYSGHGTGTTSWGPIMGNPYGHTMTQWSKGEYTDASNTEDDIAIIANGTNGFGFVADDAGGTQGTSTAYNPPDGVALVQGVLASDADADFYKIQCNTAPLNLTCTPSSPFPNLDVSLELYDTLGQLVAVDGQANTLAATVSYSVPTPGNYILAVRASGNGSADTGYTSYGSQGRYTITGSFTTLPSTPVFTLQPKPVSVVEGAGVTLQAKAITTGGIGYQWYKDTVQIQGATTASLKLTAQTTSALYKVLATNASNPSFNAFSDEVQVTVNAKPKIAVGGQPLPATVLAGNSHTFSATVTGTVPLTYTWERNNVPLGPPVQTSTLGAGNIQLTLNNVQLASAGTYRVKITNATGTVLISSAVALKVSSPPVILTQPPANIAIAVGASTTLKVTVAGDAPFQYQWFKVGSGAIPKAKAASLTVKDAGTYYVEVTNAISGLGAPTASANVVVEVHAKPVITGQPQPPSPAISTGDVDNIDFTVAASGTGPLTYEWFKDGTKLPLAVNATAESPTLSIHPVEWINRGAYKVIIRNRVGSVTSKIVTIAVNSKPVILTQPVNPAKGPTGGSVSMAVVAGGSSPLTYQWFKDGNPILNAKAAKLALSKLSVVKDNGVYFCRVSNKFGGASSTDTDSVTLTVEDAPKITSITSDAVIKHKVVLNGTITITATATGGGLNYEWLKAGKVIAGQTNSTLTLFPAQTTDSASYTVRVSNAVGKVTSAAVVVAVLLPPSINQIPTDVTVIEDSPASFSVVASGSPALTYQWWKSDVVGGAPIVAMLPGKTSATLYFAKAAISDAHSYYCVVKNDVGTATSPLATLVVQQIPQPTITSFYPKTGKAGQLVRVTGTNLQYIATAKFAATTGTFTIVSSNEILVTVPTAGAIGNMPITLTSKGQGLFVTTPVPFVKTADYANDNYVDAAIITGTSSSSGGYNYGFTPDIDYPINTAWYWWIAPRNGQYEFQIYADFDSTIGVYRGSPTSSVGSLSLVAFADDPYFGSTGEYVTVNALAGDSYLIQIGDYPAPTPTAFGFSLSLFPLAFSMVADSNFETPEGSASGESSVGQNGWVEQSDRSTPAATVTANSEGNHEVHLGGGGATDATPVLLANGEETTATDGQVIVAFKMGLQQPETAESHDWFNWTLYGEDGTALGSLQVSAADGSLYSTTADGVQTSLGQRLSLAEPHKFEMLLNGQDGTWEAAMDGVTISSGVKLPAGTRFKEVCPVWLPSSDGSPHATLIFDDVQIYVETK